MCRICYKVQITEHNNILERVISHQKFDTIQKLANFWAGEMAQPLKLANSIYNVVEWA